MSKDIIVKFDDEDHTLGSILQHTLNRHPDTIYSAYHVPHPLIKSMELYLMTLNKPAQEILHTCVKKLEGDIRALRKLITINDY